MASRSGSGSGFAVGLERTQPYPAWSLPSPPQAASRPPAPSSSSPLPLALPPFRRSSRPPDLAAASLFSAPVMASAQNPAPGLLAAPQQQREQRQQQPQQRLYAQSSTFQSPRFSSASAASAISAASASASSAAAVAASSPLVNPPSATARPILPPLPQISPLSQYSTPRQQRHSLFSPSTPASASAPASASPSQPGPANNNHHNNNNNNITGTGASFSTNSSARLGSSAFANPSGLSTLQPDPFSPLNSPFDRPPVFGPQSTNPWSAYASQLSQSDGWPQDDAAPEIFSRSARSRALSALDRLFNEATFGSFTPQQPSLQSPSQLPQSPFSRFPPPSPASASSSTTAFLPAPSPLTTTNTAPSAQLQPQNGNTRPSRMSFVANTALPPTVPPVSEQAFSPLNTFGGYGFPNDTSELDGLFCDLDGFQGFPLPLTNFSGASESSTFNTMPTTSGRLRSRVPPENPPSSTTVAPSRKRRRISPSAAAPPPPSAQTTLIEDEFDDIDSLFGSSPSRPASANSKVEDYTTIDLTEATDVPEELKKPEVDKRVKLSAFQCVICMDDVTGLTLTHCGHLFCAQCLHSSLSMEPTRGKCPMCRTKIDMKPRATYSTKTKGYWPLELKLMTRTRQGKRKAQELD
ncbi:hypothetical protein V8C44DRAFT_370100 [Trichoderma aethiopicum]